MTITDTPSLVVHLPTVKRNIAKLADYAAQHNLKIRPHTKTHKSVYMARLQMQAGATGLTVAKAGEAEVMSEASQDLFVAYPALDPARAQRLAKLAQRLTLRVGLDSAVAADAIADAARAASATVGILVDLDIGFHRTGVQSPLEALALAQHISRTRGLRLDGIMGFPGNLKGTLEQQTPVLRSINAMLHETLDLLRKNGLDAPIVSGGSSPSAYFSHAVDALTEIRPGTYIYHDMNQVHGGFATIDDCAARLECTVVSNAVPGKFVIDAGSKALTMDRCAHNPDTAGHGYVIEYPQARIVRLSEEHGEVDASQCDRTPRLGERVRVIPNHICPCVNLHNHFWLRDENDTLHQLPVNARGMVT
jgi:D-serine deaminase-like pyridoxal phosphate-dependent protein